MLRFLPVWRSGRVEKYRKRRLYVKFPGRDEMKISRLQSESGNAIRKLYQEKVCISLYIDEINYWHILLYILYACMYLYIIKVDYYSINPFNKRSRLWGMCPELQIWTIFVKEQGYFCNSYCEHKNRFLCFFIFLILINWRFFSRKAKPHFVVVVSFFAGKFHFRLI